MKLKAIQSLDGRAPGRARALRRLARVVGAVLYFSGRHDLADAVSAAVEKNQAGAAQVGAVKDYAERSVPPPLTDEQKNVLAAIEAKKDFGVHLLFGVTGSGKTEVYLHFARRSARQRRQCLVLVPEIALTPQLIDRFFAPLPGRSAPCCTRVSRRAKRPTQWWNVVDGKRKILIGARSALFCRCPISASSFSTWSTSRATSRTNSSNTHARDAAIMLAKRLNVPIVLGFGHPVARIVAHNVLQGKYLCHRMLQRCERARAPHDRSRRSARNRARA